LIRRPTVLAEGTNEVSPAGEGKPTWHEYTRWLRTVTGIDEFASAKRRYETVGLKIKNDVETSPFWVDLKAALPDLGDAYTLESTYKLFATSDAPQVYLKSYGSVLDKSYRKNVLNNRSWPQSPDGGWVTPANWFDRMNDLVRTTLVVKYLDGVKFVVERLKELAKAHEQPFAVDFEARDEGYYAAHCYVWFEIEIPKVNWDTERASARLEIQVTTQLQDVIRKLTHDYYEQRRSRVAATEIKWQWDYESPEFVPNYLGHILHYIEGMIMEVRSRRSPS
jgi:Region found in RelA / SpoT proteins